MVNDNPIKVFLADDHTILREGIAALLFGSPEFRIVGQCGDGAKLVEQVLAARPDVAVLDITMPGLNGLDACRELSRKAKNLAMLILTMHNNEQFIARALEYGAGGYLLKESAGSELRNALKAVMRGDLYLGSGISRSIVRRIAKGENDPHELLTSRERQVLQLIAEGKTNPQIAREQGLSVKTVNAHRWNMMRKLNIHDKATLVRYALRKGIIPPG